MPKYHTSKCRAWRANLYRLYRLGDKSIFGLETLCATDCASQSGFLTLKQPWHSHKSCGAGKLSLKSTGCVILIGLVTQGAEVRIPGPALTFVVIGHEIFSTAIRLLPLIKVERFSVLGTSKGTQYWLSPGKVWLG